MNHEQSKAREIHKSTPDEVKEKIREYGNSLVGSKGVEDAAKETLESRRALMQEAIGKANDSVKKVVWGEKGNNESVFKLGFVGGYMSGHREGRQANQLPGVEECIEKAVHLNMSPLLPIMLSRKELEILINFSQGKTI